MQSQSTDVSHNEPVDSFTSKSASSTQHGLRNDPEPPSSPSLHEAGEGLLQQCDDTDASSVSSGQSTRGWKHDDIGGLKSHEKLAHGGSPQNRIEHYERRLFSPFREEYSVSFQAIPSTKDDKDHTSINRFPNGMSLIVHEAHFCNIL